MTARDPGVMRERSELPRCRSLRCTACAASRVLCLSAALALALAAAGTAQAQSSGGAYTMNPQSIDAGGGRATGSVFALEEKGSDPFSDAGAFAARGSGASEKGSDPLSAVARHHRGGKTACTATAAAVPPATRR